MKTCTLCNIEKNLEEFAKHKKGKGGLHPHCKACANKRTSEWRKQNPELYKTIYQKRNNSQKTKELNRINILKRNFNITIELYNKMLKDQDNKCKICNLPEITKNKNGVSKFLSVDHCHKTGKIRGLLCSKCNSFLGMANDNINILKSAIIYLKNT